MIIEELVTVMGVDVESEGLQDLVAGIGKATLVIGGLVAAAKTVTGVLGSAFTAADRNDELSKLAAGLDLTTQSIERLEFAGKRFGVEGGEMRGVLKSLREEVDQIFTGENPEGAVSLARLGIDLDQLQDVNGEIVKTDRLLSLIADGFQSTLRDNEAFARSSVSRLGFSSPEFQELLSGGSGRIDALSRRADELRSIASDAAIKTSRDFTVATDEFGAAIQGFVNTRIVPALGPLTEVTEELTEMIVALTGDPGEDIWLVRQIDRLVFGLREAKGLFDGLDGFFEAAEQDDTPLSESLAFAIDRIKELATGGGGSSEPFNFDSLKNPLGLPADFGLGVNSLAPGILPSAATPGGSTIKIENDVKIIGSPDPAGNLRRFRDFNLDTIQSGVRDGASGFEN